MVIPSPVDDAHLRLLRANIDRFLSSWASRLDGPGIRVLDVAPQDHAGAAPHFSERVETLDIEPTSGADHIGDLCAGVSTIENGTFDVVVCTEVLEHVLQPFAAAEELIRFLAPGGHLLVTTPFNLRIHGPLPDCWRFTEYGLRALFAAIPDVAIVELDGLETEDRPLMPIQYTLVAQRAEFSPN